MFHKEIKKEFELRRFIADEKFIFNRLHIELSNEGIVRASMQEFMETIKEIEVSRERRKQRAEKCSPGEITSYLSLTGKLKYLGHGLLPQAIFGASSLQQLIGDLRVEHLVAANLDLREVKSLDPAITYETTEASRVNEASILTCSDASRGKMSCGQTGYIAGIYLPGQESTVYHVLDWHSSKQSRVFYSSFGAEILAAADSADRAAWLSDCLKSFYRQSIKLPLVLTVDSKSLYSTSTTLHDGKDYRLRSTVCSIRDSFETGEIHAMQWMDGERNVADALTKRNVRMFKLLNSISTRGAVSYDMFFKAKRVIC